MISIKDFMTIINYSVGEGSEYCWNCYGPNAYRLEKWNGENNGWSIGIIYDTVTSIVYEATVYDYKRNRAYRLVHPEFVSALRDEAKARDVDIDQAWDNVKYIDLETNEDYIEKAQAILEDRDYDTRVQVPINLPDDEMLRLMTHAHELDMTFNQLVERILIDAIEQHNSSASMKSKRKK